MTIPRLGLALCCIAFAHSTLAERTQVTLREEPVKVTAHFDNSDVGVYFAQISVQNGPIAQLVDTTLHATSPSAVTRLLGTQVRSQPPYLLVHASCGGGSTWSCENETVFKVIETRVLRLGTVLGSAKDVLRNGRFYDVYDKLEQVSGVSHAAAPSFQIVLEDRDNALQVNGALTWAANAEQWRNHAGTLTALEPETRWTDNEWEPYLSAALSNAALARYCDHQEELAALLKEVEPKLDATRRRTFTDALSKVTPLEAPKRWRASK